MSGITSFLSVLRGGGKPRSYRPYLIPMNLDGKPSMAEKRYFQYYPENIRITKATNWETKNIIGLSHPLYQFISGGAREISFSTRFTRDRAPTQDELKQLRSAAIRNTFGLSSSTQDQRNVDIPSAVGYLQQFCMPSYKSDISGQSNLTSTVAFATPPRRVFLNLPNLRAGLSSGGLDDIICIMTQCEVTYQSFFSDGSPRLAQVDLQFVETIQTPDKIVVHDASNLAAAGASGYQLTVGPQDKKG